MTGATGLIGRRLVIDRLERGDQVVILSRSAERAARLFAAEANPNVQVVEGNPAQPGTWQGQVDGCDAVIHLAGAGLVDQRWTRQYKQEVYNSRIDSTFQVASAIRDAGTAPGVFLTPSGVNFYGPTGVSTTDETGEPGTDFLANLCVQWENQAAKARSERTRVAMLRTGMVLDERGGALAQMLTPFKLFVGGPLGFTHTYVSWIHWRDLINMYDFALREPRVSGPLNATSPQPCTNRELAAAVGAAVGRPSWLPVPYLAMRVALGEVAKYISASLRVVPAKAQELGFCFQFIDIDRAIEKSLADHDETAAQRAEKLAAQASKANAPSSPTNEMTSAKPQATERSTTRSNGPESTIKLIAMAVDNVLLRRDGGLPRGVVRACRVAQQAGVILTIATSRPPRGIRSIVETLRISHPTIHYDGALIWDHKNRCAVHHERLDAELARKVIDAARGVEHDVFVGIDTFDQWVTDQPVDGALPKWVRGIDDPARIAPLDECLSEPVTRLNFVASPEQLQPVFEMIRENYWRQREIALFRPQPHVIQVTHPMVDKGIALQRIARRLGVEKASVMAIGHGLNDAGMVEWAGFGVAMEDAAPRIGDLADATVPDSDEQGVVRAIHQFALSRP